MEAHRLRITVQVHADLRCGWCFVAKRVLDKATRRYALAHPGVRFAIQWRPCRVLPLLEQRCEKLDFYEQVERVCPGAVSGVYAAARAQGVRFAIRGAAGDPRRAEGLVRRALRQRGHEAQDGVVEALFCGHFQEGRDLSDEAWLGEVAAKAGLREEHEDQEDQEEEEEEEVLEPEAVPCVIIQGRFKVGGYQEAHVYEGVFDKVCAAA